MHLDYCRAASFLDSFLHLFLHPVQHLQSKEQFISLGCTIDKCFWDMHLSFFKSVVLLNFETNWTHNESRIAKRCLQHGTMASKAMHSLVLHSLYVSLEEFWGDVLGV